MATIQKRKNQNGTLGYRVMIRTKDGLPPSYKTFPTHQEAKDWALQEEARRRQGLYFPEQNKAKHTLATLIDRYIAIILSMRPKNAVNTKRHLDWWKQQLGKYALTAISPDLIAQLRQELAQGLTTKGTLRSPATVNRYLAALSAALSYGVKECGWLNDNPCRRVSKLRESKGRDRVASRTECNRILNACETSRNPHLLAIVLLAITTGMRQGEILGLTWENIDFERETITLKETKNGRPRTVSLVGNVFNLLRERWHQRDFRVSLIFPARIGSGQACIRKAWREALTRAQVHGLRFHDLRHTFATYAAEAGASNLELATAMGHQTLQMLQRYTHMNSVITHKLSTAVHQKLMMGEHGKD